MTGSPVGALLDDAIGELESALRHFRYSADVVDGFSDDLSALDEAALESVEAYTSRFARVVDLLVSRVLRAIDRFELHEPGTPLDVANRAEKRGLIGSVDWLRELKDMRNRIAHDYAGKQLEQIFAFCRQQTDELLATCVRVQDYVASVR